MAGKVNHDYHILEPDIWPLIGAIAISVLLQMSVVTMPFARPFFESAEHFGSEWLLIVLLAPLPAVVIELTKVFKRGSAVSPERGVL